MATRRDFLSGVGKTGVLSGLMNPRLATGQTTAPQKFVFVTCFGGWDATRVLIPEFDNPLVNMESLAEPIDYGRLRIVDHPERPAVREFFDQFSSYSTVVHGILTPSVAHEACLQLIRTGFLSGYPDWPTILGERVFSESPIPHLVLSGEHFAGDLGYLVAKTGVGGQLDALLDGRLDLLSDVVIDSGDERLRLAEMQLRQRRLQKLLQSSNQTPEERILLNQMAVLSERAQILRERPIRWNTDGSFIGDCQVAADVLTEGLTSCVSLTHPALWDSHSDNDVFQQWLWEELFYGLGELCGTLAATPSGSGTLLDETTIVVVSDMGRSPTLNASLGKDHWPYSSALIISSAIEGNRSVGGYDSGFQGLNIASIVDASEHPEQWTAHRFGQSLLSTIWGVDI